MKHRMGDVAGLGVALLAVAAVSALGGMATASSVSTWYQGLTKPSFNPPDWVFTPVWTTLYLAMAVAAWLVWLRRERQPVGRPLTLWAVQLALNLGWSILFFGLQAPGWALAEIIVLWLAIAATLVAFWRIRTAAGWLLVPYLAWVSFATALNAAIVRLN